MNIQAMMKQAQKMQGDMMKVKNEVESKIFNHTKSFVSVESTGDKKIKNIKIDMEVIEKEDLEVAQDLIMVTINEINEIIDKEMDEKMSKYTKGMPGLF